MILLPYLISSQNTLIAPEQNRLQGKSMENDQPLNTVEILQTLGNPIRKSVMISLSTSQKALRFSELMKASGLDPNSESGQFMYHLSELMKREIIFKKEEKYLLSSDTSLLAR